MRTADTNDWCSVLLCSPTWIHLTATSLYDAGDDKDQQQQRNDAHQDDEPSN